MCLPIGSWARWASCKYFMYAAHQSEPQNVKYCGKMSEYWTPDPWLCAGTTRTRGTSGRNGKIRATGECSMSEEALNRCGNKSRSLRSIRVKPLTFIGSPQGAMGVRGPQGPRGPTGPRVSSVSPLTPFENDDLQSGIHFQLIWWQCYCHHL